MRDDIDINRRQEVLQLQAKNEKLEEQLEYHKSLVNKWAPVIESSYDANGGIYKFTMKFNNKISTFNISEYELLNIDDLDTAKSYIVESLINSLIKPQIIQLFDPKMQSAIDNAKTLQGVGKWLE